MNQESDSKPAAAGCLLAVAILVGATIGMFARQPSAGVVGGAIVGIVVAVAYWWVDRKRAGR